MLTGPYLMFVVCGSQLRAVAEAAIRELQTRVKDREAQVAELAAKMQEHQAAYLAQHAKDRSEIEVLNNKLFESGAASIAGLKADLARATTMLAATGDGREEVGMLATWPRNPRFFAFLPQFVC
jgi:hypothetical protein